MKKFKKVISLLISVCLLMSLVTVSHAAEGNTYNYLGDMYSFTNANSDNSYVFTDAEAYTNDISIHFVHGDNTDATTMKIGTGDSRIPMSTSYGGKVEPTIQFYAKGTLPSTATINCAWTNGSINHTKDISWKEGEVDENGWRLVSFNMGHLTVNNAGMTGGHAVFTLNITGAADFYMDDINISYTPWTSNWTEGTAVKNILSAANCDNSFENVEMIVPVEPEKEYKYLGDMYSFTNANSNNTYAFTDAEAYTNDISIHFVHGDNTDATTMKIGTGDSRIPMSTSYGGKVEPTIQFYAKGTLPSTATINCAWTNGSINHTKDISWKEGEVDENGWRLVSFNMGHLTVNNAGMTGGHAVFTLNITGAADFYMDDINISYTPWTSNWTEGTAVKNILSAANCDNSFENIEKPIEDKEYSAERTTYVMNHNEYTVSGATEANWYSFTDEEAKTGSKSLHLVHKKDNADALKFTVNHCSKLFNVGGYATSVSAAFKFYAKGVLPESANLQLAYTNGNLNWNVDRASWVVGDADANGWRQVTISGTGALGSLYGGLINANMTITGQCDMYIDDLSLTWTQSGTSAELLSKYGYDTSFENTKYKMSNVATEKENIRSLTYDWSANAVQLSWKNPANDGIKSFKVLKDGVDVTGNTTFDLKSMAVNKFDISGLDANEAYDFSVVMTTEDGEKTQNITAYTNSERNWVRFTHDKYPLGGGDWNPYWSATNDGTGFNTNIGFYVDETEKYAGQSSLKLVSNNQNKPNQYMYMLHSMAGLDTASKYTFSFMGKAVDAGKMKFAVNFGNSNTYTSSIVVGESGYLFNDGWREYSVELSAPATATDNLRIELNGECDAFYIDNMKLVKTGDTTNLISNGGFEYDISGVAFDEATKTLTWTADEEPWDKYVIYKVDARTGNEIEVADFAPADLVNGNKYVDSVLSANSMYTVKTYFDVNGASWLSDGLSTADWDVTYPVFDTVAFGTSFDKYGENAEVIGEATAIDAEGGYYMASIGVDNQDAEDVLNFRFFTALYKDNVMVDIVALDGNFDAGAVPTVFRGVVNVPAKVGNENYVIKAFVWNGEGLAPLTQTGEISSVQ